MGDLVALVFKFLDLMAFLFDIRKILGQRDQSATPPPSKLLPVFRRDRNKSYRVVSITREDP